jgi:hypothetical protein
MQELQADVSHQARWYPVRTEERTVRRGRIENLIPWKPGQSGNPGGRPKTAHISQALRTALANGKADEFAEILCAVASGRKKGTPVQLAALREIADRTEGRPHQSLNVDASVNIAERLNEARKRLEAQRREALGDRTSSA